MIDSFTHKPIRVHDGGKAGPYIIVQWSQLEALRKVLQENHIPHWPDEFTISVDGKPDVIFVNLGRQVVASEVQKLLDGVPPNGAQP